MSILLLGNGEQVSIMTAEGGECVIINYDYQQVVKLYPECKRLATLFVNYKDCCNIKVLATNGIPSNIWQGSIRYINRLADYEEFGINSWFVIDRPSPNSDFLYLGWTFGDFRLKSDLIETWNFDSGLSKVRPKATTWKKLKGWLIFDVLFDAQCLDQNQWPRFPKQEVLTTVIAKIFTGNSQTANLLIPTVILIPPPPFWLTFVV